MVLVAQLVERQIVALKVVGFETHLVPKKQGVFPAFFHGKNSKMRLIFYIFI